MGNDLTDPEPDPDVLRAGRQRGEEHVGCRAVGVLVEEVVLHRPRVLDTEPIGQLDLLDRLLDELVLRTIAPRLWQLELVEHAEAHGHASWMGRRP